MALVSCQPVDPEEEYKNKDLTIQASIASTKASAKADGIAWTSGDALLVTCDGEAYNFSTSQGGTTADFVATDGLTQEKVGINPLTAYYGCTQFGAFTIPQNQSISGSESQTRLPMYAYTATAPEKAKVSMSFTPAASMLEVTISPAEITLNKVELVPVEETSVVGNVAGAGTVNALTGKVSFSGNLKSVAAIFQGGASVKNGLTFRLPIGWFSVTGGMKLVLTYNETDSYEEVIWDGGAFQSYDGSADAKAYKFIPVNVELVMGARDFYVSPNGKASSKGIKENDPTTLDYALSSADAGSVIHLAAGTYNPVRSLLGDETGAAGRKTLEISRALTLVGAGPDKTFLDAAGAFHAVCVTALPDAKVTLKDLCIKGGDTTESQADGEVISPVNEKKYSDEYGSGLFVSGSDIVLENVKITGNKGKNAVGAYINGAKASLKNVEVSGNESTGNGSGFWASASELTMEGCTVSGNKCGGVASGLYIYSAAETTCTATVKDCVFTANETEKNNSAIYVRGADATASVSATITGCVIKENKGVMGAGFGVTYATVLLDGCQVLDNTSSGNGANLVYPGAKVTFKDCIFRGNTATLAAAAYLYTDKDAAELTVLNSEFSGNTTAGRGGAIYARAGSAEGVKLHVANSTFYGNQAASTGSAIALYGKADMPVVVNIYSSTITGNTCTRTSNTPGGAIGLETAGLTANIYNSVISGNIWEAAPASADLFVKAGTATVKKSVINTAVYGADGAVVSGAPAFAAASMLSMKKQDGKTTVFSLAGSDNPAKTYGYDVAGLKALGASIDGSILEKDQWGNSRSASVMGAYVE